MKVSVKTLKGEQFDIDVTITDTVSSLPLLFLSLFSSPLRISVFAFSSRPGC
jgi:hypothetical protein